MSICRRTPYGAVSVLLLLQKSVENFLRVAGNFAFEFRSEFFLGFGFQFVGGTGQTDFGQRLGQLLVVTMMRGLSSDRASRWAIQTD